MKDSKGKKLRQPIVKIKILRVKSTQYTNTDVKTQLIKYILKKIKQYIKVVITELSILFLKGRKKKNNKTNCKSKNSKCESLVLNLLYNVDVKTQIIRYTLKNNKIIY